jgi:NhaA family Na+:H+ antiporter
MSQGAQPANPPPESSTRAWSLALKIARPVERFLHIEAASGILLLMMAVVALIWANSAWAATYEHLLHTPISISFGSHVFSRSVHFWINDILMAIFFFVVGLEIRRELFEGELSELRRAMLPVAAALGGMVLPAIIYSLINRQVPASQGWGIPMATDIAFAVGVLAILGKRVPAALRILLLAVAIIDDIGAILVIAFFYCEQIDPQGLAIAGAGVVAVIAMQRIGVRNPFLYVIPGVVVWAGMLRTGIHPTVAGVVLGMLTPVRAWYGRQGFVKEASAAIKEIEAKQEQRATTKELLPTFDRFDRARREALAPVTRLEVALHPWVAFGIMPLFALANAGVRVDSVNLANFEIGRIAVGVSLGLVLGKPVGIVLFSWIATRIGLAALPRGVGWRGLVVVGCVAGIGFTMALFIGALALADPEMLAGAKLAVLVGSAISGVLGLVLGLKLLPKIRPPEITQTTPHDAEHSTAF